MAPRKDEVADLAAPTARHLWLWKVPVATKGKNIGKPFEGSCYWDRIPKAWIEKWKDREITNADIFPDDAREMDDRFKAFLDSHIPQFDQLIAYEEFYLYCERARRWLEDKRTIADIHPMEQGEWKEQELYRMSESFLYALEKYVTIKEDGFMGGRRKFMSSAPQAFLAFICNRRNHFDLVKGRQAAVTSEVLAIVDVDMITTPSWTGVFMVHKKDGTGKGLFRDKHQSTLQHFPKWIVDEIDVSKGFSTESTIIDFDGGGSKVSKGMDISEFRLLSAEDSMVVNGKTPTISLFDECQNIPTYGTIKKEISPALMQLNPETGEMDVKRCIWAWGTGSSNNTGAGAFEGDFKALLERWNSRANTHGWVPLFFDWTCRPGMTLKVYLEKREEYLSGQNEDTKGLSQSERLSLFCAHYPSKPDDAFMSTHKTLVPMEMIVKQQQRIISLCHKAEPTLQPVPGRFVPVFDESISLPADSYFPHPVRSARWEPARWDDVEAPVKMFMPPDHSKQWVNRFFQGTDPIANDGGFSRFSSAIWDAAARVEGEGDSQSFIPTVACMLNARTAFPQDLFVQCALMGMYYANKGQKACKEIVEINAGHRYVDFKCSPVFGLRESLITRTQLPPLYRGGAHMYGLDLKGGKGSRKESLYGDLTNLLRANWHNIWYYDLWSQVRHISVESKPDGSTQWGTQNKNVYNDDMVYAVGYAELCCRAVNKMPELVSADAPKYTIKRRIVRDANLMPHYINEKVPVVYR